MCLIGVHKSTWILTLLTILLVLSSCGKEQPPVMEEAEDPCDCATEVSAEFEILEILAPFGNWESDIRTSTDVILSQKNVEFKAKMENADHYTWYIGTEVLDTRSVIRYFDDAQVGQQITVSLAVRSEPNINCFPNDDGYDSISKTFEVMYKCDSALMEGWFRVAPEGSADSLDIGFDIRLRKVGPSAGNCHFVDIYNYNGLGDTLDHYVAGDYLWRNYRYVKMDGIVAINPYNSFYYEAEIDFNNEFHLYISRGNPVFNSQQDPFPEIYHGRKL
ncbi:hypothetical protein [Parvicella tangerina]|uniref:Uncharacterized protein n=1 Tax=Parvicella tangerina TaxID=2829795 RepID=A0A916JQ30_9FLAO|nr:hypothetical protein [Parvicella tangerina]CAG5086957.1 hypothetical protein CRYO30217_03349 [Parvicella tangerina]